MEYNKMEIVAQDLLDIQSLKECQEELVERIMEQLAVKLDICTGLPIVGLFTTMHKVSKSFFDYKMCMRLLNFYAGCKNMSQQKKDTFYEKNICGKEAEIGYKILQLLDRLDVDEKALLVGKLYVHCSDKDYDINSYFRICRVIENCFYDDLKYLMHWKERDIICAQNGLIPQEIMDSLYSAGLLAQEGINGGGFKDEDEAGTEFSLNKYAKVLLDIL